MVKVNILQLLTVNVLQFIINDKTLHLLFSSYHWECKSESRHGYQISSRGDDTNKDIPLAGNVTMNQESFVQSSQAILQGLAEGGYIHTKTPKFECFFGDDKKNKLDFDMWERQILSAAIQVQP